MKLGNGPCNWGHPYIEKIDPQKVEWLKYREKQ
jgi:hypothetical protein